MVMDDVSRIAGELRSAEVHPTSKQFILSGLIARLVEAIADAELRDREAIANETYRPRSKVGSAQYLREQASLEREMARIQREAEKKIVSPLTVTLLSGLTSHELISSAVGIDSFPILVRQSFGNPVDKAVVCDLENAVAEIRQLVRATEDRPALTDSDLVTLIILAALMADGFDYVDQRNALKNLYQIRRSSAVFIDEVQDFCEIEVLLMGLTAMSTYSQITLSGDRCQRLQSAGSLNYDYLFPWVPRTQNNGAIFLDHNFRQRPELAEFSSSFRALIQNDDNIEFEETSHRTNIYKYGTRERMAGFILQQIRSVPKHATIAVITPTFNEAQEWFDLLEDELGAYHRPALMSRREDLTRRFNVHFTEVREVKGLEFNVVVVPNLGSFALDNEIGRNQTYVAITRPKHSLLLGCTSEATKLPEIDILETLGVVCVLDLPTH
jgi:hypothetical protein